MSSANATFSSPTQLSQTTGAVVSTPLTETAHHSPALAYGGGRLYLAWRETTFLTAGRLRFMYSTNGLTFNTSTKLEFNTRKSHYAPGLFYWADGTANGKLYLVWTEETGHLLNILVSADKGVTWASQSGYTVGGGNGPSLIGLPTSGTASAFDLHLMFANTDGLSNKNLSIMTADNAATAAFQLPHKMENIETQERLATTTWNSKAYVAWTDYNERPRLGRWSPGELVVYGKLQ
jgi:hypothetical protein